MCNEFSWERLFSVIVVASVVDRYVGGVFSPFPTSIPNVSPPSAIQDMPSFIVVN